jgi:lipoprotein-releasing system permease protein
VYKSFLSWRYIVARRTNWIGVVGITVGVGALILILSIMAGFLAESRKTLRGSLSDLIIEPFMVARRGAPALPTSPTPLLEHVRADPRVAAASAHLTWGGMIVHGNALDDLVRQNPRTHEDGFVQLVGIDAADELETTDLGEALRRASRLGTAIVEDPSQPFAPPPGAASGPYAWIVVGEQLAYTHGLRRGSEINVVTVMPDDGGRVRDANRKFRVAGTFRSGENEVDRARIYLDRSELADFLGHLPERIGERADRFSQVLVRLHDYASDGQALKADLRRGLFDSGLVRDLDAGEVKTWEDHRQNLLGAIENEKTLLGIMLSLVLVVAGFTVFAILSMLVTEKRRDIGILTALGATPGGIMGLYLMIGFWDALLGCLAGSVIGVLSALKIDAIEQSLSRAFGYQIFNRDVYLFDHIPSVVDPTGVALIVGGAFVCTLLFAAFPAWRAARLHPIDALRYE